MRADFYSTSQLALDQRFRGWCREGELNPQGAKHRRILSPLRLPVPPSRLEEDHSKGSTWMRTQLSTANSLSSTPKKSSSSPVRRGSPEHGSRALNNRRRV